MAATEVMLKRNYDKRELIPYLPNGTTALYINISTIRTYL